MFDLLRGLKVVDLTTIVLGPYATQTLADFGAEVIKVEPPGGDILRAVRPGRRKDLGVQFQNFNRNKRSLTIDLKQVRGREVLHSLVEKSDVVVHNMRSRSAASLGASYAELSACNPKLVYCYSAGYGDSGPDRDAPAYDDIIQARSGLASLNADANGAPQFVRTIVGDKVVGLHLAIAVLAGVVLGGLFAESVDFSAVPLKGVIAVGVGLPPPTLTRTCQEQYFDHRSQNGKQVAFLQPAMTKVLQVTGRLLRSPDDRGIICLVDPRFCDSEYQQFFPAHWQGSVVSTANAGKVVANFWEGTILTGP